MKTIKEQLEYIKSHKKIGLMTHVVAGFPSIEETEQLVCDMEKAGADFVEIQIPFSDPLADGTTIMHANDIALEHGITTHKTLKLINRLSQKITIPLLCMSYYNSIFTYGTKHFCKDSHHAGVQALIVPDMPIDEESHEHFMKYCKEYNLNHIRLLSPTSTDERIKLNALYQNGFVYATAQAATTGAKEDMDAGTIPFLKKVKKHIHVPLAVGFGISKKEHISSLISHADIAVVGSAVIKKVQEQGISSVRGFIEDLSSVTKI